MSAPAPRFANDDDAAQYWLRLLRDGNSDQKIQAREQLATIFERRGMFEEAIDLLISNLHDGVRSADIFRWLSRLYRYQGQEVLAMQAAAEAAKYLAPPSRSAVRPAAHVMGTTPSASTDIPVSSRVGAPDGVCATCGYINRHARRWCKRCRAPLHFDQRTRFANDARAHLATTELPSREDHTRVGFDTTLVTRAPRVSSRIVLWIVGTLLFIAFVAGIETLGEKPGQLNPLRSVWYIFVLAG
jgi:hypothetical protein